MLAGDVFYEQPMARHVERFCDEAVAAGVDVVVGDPGREYLPRRRVTALGELRGRRDPDLEGGETTRTTVCRFDPRALTPGRAPVEPSRLTVRSVREAEVAVRAVQVVRLDGPDAVEVAEVDEPKAGDGQVLIDVEAAGVVFPDLLLTRGEYQMKPDLPFLLGSEVAGTVREAPDGSGFTAGDRVAAMPRARRVRHGRRRRRPSWCSRCPTRCPSTSAPACR